MGSLFFSPSGQIDSRSFMQAGLILIVIGAVLTVVKNFSPGLAAIASLLSLIMIYPWVCIWIKRLRNGGKSGAMVLVYILLYIVLVIVAAMIAMFAFGGGEFMAMISEYASGEISMAEYQAKAQAFGQTIGIPMAIATAVASYATIFIGDKTIPNDVVGDTYS